MPVDIAFFYFSFNDNSKQDASNMLRSLLLQLSDQLDDGYTDLNRLHNDYRSGSPPVSALIATLQKVVQKFQDVYLLIDALDESPQLTARVHLLDVLTKLQEWKFLGLHILITSRDIPDVRETFQNLGPNISMKNEAVDRDIADFIAGHLKESKSLRKLSDYHDLIQEALTARARGVFRWVECQFKSLALCPRSERTIRKRLDSLPQSLDETYERVLLGIDKDLIEDARRIFTLLCYSERPMTVSEIIDGVAVELGEDPRLDLKHRFTNESDILLIRPGFIDISLDPNVQRTDQIVRISHSSVQDYLESERILQQETASFKISKFSAHAELAEICLIYLLDSKLSDASLTKAIYSQRPLVEYAAGFWHRHYVQTGNIRPQIEELVYQLFEIQPRNFENWIRIRNPEFTFPPFNLETPSSNIPSSVYYASMLGLSSVLTRTLQIQDAKASVISKSYDLVNASGGFHRNALQAALFTGHKEVIQVLLDRGAEVNAQGGMHGNALETASYRGFREVVQLLLDRGAEVNAQVGIYSNALQAASYSGYKEVAQLLLDRGAEINAQGGHYGNALQAASCRGCKEVVQLLLDRGAGGYDNALEAALSEGYEEVAQLLRDHGAKTKEERREGEE